MSTLDLITDAPGMLRAEAINITLNFERTGPSTGRISWNIPTPATGCAAEKQAYCGMLATIDTKPTSIDKIPSNGTFYNSDPTADPNLFAGDKLGSAFVVGAFYQDRTTTFFDIDGLMPNTPYYVTGFPMDCQARYFIEGVHAYSQDFVNRGTDGTQGSQVVQLNPMATQQGVKLTDATGLMHGVTYDFTVQVGVTPKPNRPVSPTECSAAVSKYHVELDGVNAQTYEDLVAELNKQFATLLNCAQGPYAPNTGAFYYNLATQRLFRWTGSSYEELSVINSKEAPDQIKVGTYWYNPATKQLKFWNNTTWVDVTLINFKVDPTKPVADQTYWFDGVQAYLWNGTTWCTVQTYVQTTDPALSVTPIPGSYWYDQKDSLYKWNNDFGLWQVASAVESDIDPNQLPDGMFWFNDVERRLYQLNTPTPGWNASPNVSVTENEPSMPGPDKLWYNPLTGVLVQRDQQNTTWIERDCITFSMDPTKRNFCDMWWNTTTDQLMIWNGLKKVWVQVIHLYNQPNDPSDAPLIADGAVWYNPDTGEMVVRDGVCWKTIDFIFWETDPTSAITLGVVWHNQTTDKWFARTLDGWEEIAPVITTVDMKSLPVGTFWFDTKNKALMMWNGMSWISILYSSAPQTPTVGQYWYDSSTSILKQWNGSGWVTATPLLTVEHDCNGNLLFTDPTVGSTSFIEITDGTLFKSLDQPSKIINPNPGTDGASDVPSYEELGVGTDGSDAIRNQLVNEIRYELGYPINNVELTKEQMDYSITKALGELRARSSICYKREMFIMKIKKNEQKYYLTNKIAGMNRIVDVLGVYRMNSAYLSSAHGAGVYGQIVMQHMYNMGTFDLLSFHLMGEYTSLMERLFATRITFNWNEQQRTLQMYQRFSEPEPMVLIEAASERTEQDIMSDRYARTWIRNYASAVCRLMLAEIRGKFSTLPGAGGSVSLNSADLRQTANEIIERCLQEIDDYIANKPDEFGVGTEIVFG